DRVSATDPLGRASLKRPRRGGRGRAGLSLACGLVAAGLATAVLVAGCGSSSSSSGSGVAHLGTTNTTAKGSTASSTKPSPLAFAECVREHGLPDFPDPTGSGQLQLPNGLTTNSPAYQAAAKHCASLIGGETTPKAITQTPQLQAAALRLALCMRSHGVPNFPDGPITKSTGINESSPAFQRAFQTCQKYLTGLSSSSQVPVTGGS
ncbi:MAG: hypothetical protein ACLP50_13340, partial [Solirubrobacteraceae bacterium]